MAVNFCHNKKKWRAEVSYKKIRMHIGYFHEQEEAVKVFDEMTKNILAGKIPERILMKLNNKDYMGKRNLQKALKKDDVLPAGYIEKDVHQPQKTTVVLFPESVKPIVIESMPVRIDTDRYFTNHTDPSAKARGYSFVSLPRVKWLEGPTP